MWERHTAGFKGIGIILFLKLSGTYIDFHFIILELLCSVYYLLNVYMKYFLVSMIVNFQGSFLYKNYGKLVE